MDDLRKIVKITILKKDETVSKLKLTEPGVYNLGRSGESQIQIDDKKIQQNHCQIIFSEKGNCSVVCLDSVTYLNGEIVNPNQKAKIHLKENELTFGTSRLKCLINIKKLASKRRNDTDNGQSNIVVNKKRERSRSKETNPTLADKKVDDETYIKSEIIWKNSSFENDQKRKKFLRLLGSKDVATHEVDTKLAQSTKEKAEKINRDLENQFYSSNR